MKILLLALIYAKRLINDCNAKVMFTFFGSAIPTERVGIAGITSRSNRSPLASLFVEYSRGMQPIPMPFMTRCFIKPQLFTSTVVYGSAGDATGYAMRGGKIYIKGNTGYRAGIHMKEYADLKPVMVIGGRAGSFLGEYRAGGVIVVLGQNDDGLPIVNNFCGTGMHGGKIYLRCDSLPHKIPEQVCAQKIRGRDDAELSEIINDYCAHFDNVKPEALSDGDFFVLTPDGDNPYKRMYTDN